MSQTLTLSLISLGCGRCSTLEFYEFPVRGFRQPYDGRDQVTKSATRTREPKLLRKEKLRLDLSDPGGRRKRGPFHGEFCRAHCRVMASDSDRWCPFCSSLKTNHQSTKAFKPKSVFNWLTGQVNSIKFLENAKSFYQTSAFASETGWEGRKKSFSQSLPFQGEFPVWDQFFTSQHCFFKDGKICRYFRRAIPGTNLVRLRSWMHPIE